MQGFDFQATSRKTTIEIQTVSSTSEQRQLKRGSDRLMGSDRSKGSDRSSFARELHRQFRNDGPNENPRYVGSNKGSSADPSKSDTGPVKPDQGQPDLQQAVNAGDVPGQVKDSGKLEVKDEKQANTDSSDKQADTTETNIDKSKDQETTGDAVQTVVIDTIHIMSLELQILEGSLKGSGDSTGGVAELTDNSVQAGISDINSTTALPADLQQDIQQILDTMKDLEDAISKLAAPTTTDAGKTANDGQDAAVKALEDKIIALLSAHTPNVQEQPKNTTRVQVQAKAENAKTPLVELLNGKSRGDSTSQGDGSQTGQQGAEDQNGSQIKKIMYFENSKRQMLKVHIEEHARQNGSAADQNSTAGLGGSGDKNLFTMNLKSLDAPFGSADKRAEQALTEPKQIIDQIVKKFEMVNKQNPAELSIQLKPEFLGKMTIKLSMEDGVLSAKFVTDNHTVKNMLENNLAMFKQQLDDAGIKVDKAEVSVQVGTGTDYNSAAGDQQGQWQFDQQNQSSAGRQISYSSQDGYNNYGSEAEEPISNNPIYDELQGDSSVSYVI